VRSGFGESAPCSEARPEWVAMTAVCGALPMVVPVVVPVVVLAVVLAVVLVAGRATTGSVANSLGFTGSGILAGSVS
jgi:hypothetical protein